MLLQAPAPDGQSRKPHQHGEGFPSCRPPPQGLELVGLGAGVVVAAVVVALLVVVVVSAHNWFSIYLKCVMQPGMS